MFSPLQALPPVLPRASQSPEPLSPGLQTQEHLLKLQTLAQQLWKLQTLVLQLRKLQQPSASPLIHVGPASRRFRRHLIEIPPLVAWKVLLLLVWRRDSSLLLFLSKYGMLWQVNSEKVVD